METMILVVFCIIVLLALFALWDHYMNQMLSGPITQHPIQQEVIKFGEDE